MALKSSIVLWVILAGVICCSCGTPTGVTQPPPDNGQPPVDNNNIVIGFNRTNWSVAVDSLGNLDLCVLAPAGADSFCYRFDSQPAEYHLLSNRAYDLSGYSKIRISYNLEIQTDHAGSCFSSGMIEFMVGGDVQWEDLPLVRVSGPVVHEIPLGLKDKKAVQLRLTSTTGTDQSVAAGQIKMRQLKIVGIK